MIDRIAEALDAEQPITENDIVVTSEQLNQLAKESTQPSKAPETEDSIDGDREFVQEKLKDAIEQATGMLPGLVALATGVPLNWLAKPMGYGAGVAEGRYAPEGPVDILQGIVSGRDGTDK